MKKLILYACLLIQSVAVHSAAPASMPSQGIINAMFKSALVSQDTEKVKFFLEHHPDIITQSLAATSQTDPFFAQVLMAANNVIQDIKEQSEPTGIHDANMKREI